MDRASQLRILVDSTRRSLVQVRGALEALESGEVTRTAYSALRRGFHTIRHDARHLRLSKLADFAQAAESIVEGAADRGHGVPIELLREVEEELRRTTDDVATGKRHAIDKSLMKRLQQAAKPASLG